MVVFREATFQFVIPHGSEDDTRDWGITVTSFTGWEAICLRYLWQLVLMAALGNEDASACGIWVHTRTSESSLIPRELSLHLQLVILESSGSASTTHSDTTSAKRVGDGVSRILNQSYVTSFNLVACFGSFSKCTMSPSARMSVRMVSMSQMAFSSGEGT